MLKMPILLDVFEKPENLAASGSCSCKATAAWSSMRAFPSGWGLSSSVYLSPHHSLLFLTQTSCIHLLHAWSRLAFGFETFSLKEERLVVWNGGRLRCFRRIFLKLPRFVTDRMGTVGLRFS